MMEKNNQNKYMQELYRKLESSSDATTPDDFLDIVDKIVAENVPRSIPVLMKYLDNEADVYLMESLMIAMESYNPDEYICEFISVFHRFIGKGSFWIKGLLYGILNNEEYFGILKKHIREADKNSMLDLLYAIERQSPPHRLQCKELIEILEN